MKYDYLIVGAGLFGATFARLAADDGKRCIVIDRRNHLGGNVYCEDIEGINVHQYGPHIFHTSNQNVWNFINKFVNFNQFRLMTVANFNGELYNLPFNMNTFYKIWGVKTPKEARRVIADQCSEISEIRNLEEQSISLVGRDIYEMLIKGYTEKQWGKLCSELPSFIIRRIPVRYTFDNNYFSDTYQGIPIGGYNKLIDTLLKGIKTVLNIDFFEHLYTGWRNIANKLVYTGKIDDYYCNRCGFLEYRSLKFEHEVLNVPNYQGIAIINYTSRDIPYTRIIEHKHFELFGEDVYKSTRTVITHEYPQVCTRGSEAYYPINDDKNNSILAQYKAMAAKEKNVIFGGRLAEYRYYNMDEVINSAILAYSSEQEKYSHQHKI